MEEALNEYYNLRFLIADMHDLKAIYYKLKRISHFRDKLEYRKHCLVINGDYMYTYVRERNGYAELDCEFKLYCDDENELYFRTIIPRTKYNILKLLRKIFRIRKKNREEYVSH